LSLALLVSLTLAGCVRNPATGKQQLSLISEQQEIELGQQAKQEVLQSVGLVDDAGLQAYVSQVGMRLAAASERPKLPWSFQVVDDASVNAFALPGGPIFVTRGLITHVTNEAELAAVLGHEIGHVTARHSVSRMSQQQLAQVGLGIGGVLLPDQLKGLGQLASVGASLLFLKYSRDDESEADRLGFRYALGQHYDVRQMENLFQMLDQVGGKEQGRLPDWLATHPAPEDRAKAAEAMLQQAAPLDFSALAVRRPEYLSHVDGLVFGENPRDGFFRGNTFYAPELQFQFQLPEGWKAVNQPQAVVSGSPQQDAILQLQAAGKLSPEEAARKFFSSKGVQQVGTAGPIPGHDGIEGHFQAQTDKGVLAGVVAFISHRGHTFQLVGYTVAERLPATTRCSAPASRASER
jgi:predicted Zn-dependent protease